ncbi:MAG: PAS domain S-box protein [Candidatus Thiodiazotropha sp. (ex Dulcina madagascariensis)]|nr:PAS domain S-box protein [Candidatus Thiodiazotropha sp. (ex Epidulcina cf. delphinae)]MCU7926641.1 PAS domain S-box protein [Candidatus Thiodiazotropha sp. (ex Dulcina madagascariensis)]MCU7937659.1 PAS domain S-box protein [Candidatus Thiodiazotropha sp. (ex Dulcina madagascariensis)]
MTDRDDSIVLVNPAAEKLLGRPLATIVSQGFYQLVGDPQMMNRLLEHADSNYAESVLQGERYLSVMAARIHTKQGGMLGMAALIRDVTVQKRRAIPSFGP